MSISEVSWKGYGGAMVLITVISKVPNLACAALSPKGHPT